MTTSHNSIPAIEYGPSLVSFSQIVPTEQAHMYENALSEILDGDWTAFDAMLTVQPYDKRHPVHNTLPGSNSATASESYVFCADMPYATFLSFMGKIMKN
ncbi:hypothetical protein [Brucella intermedia]|uniref:hypothetical protein n=1 Tax=Brucella intermedia TaxID=94625 RepID=UPI0015910ADB|nr:hypothetical protein [Brucella intermedia]